MKSSLWILLAVTPLAFAAEDRPALIEMHEKMAAAHKKAADCLKAGKPVKDCNREAMKDCPMMNTGMCPFMGDMGMMGGGMRHDGRKPAGEGEEKRR